MVPKMRTAALDELQDELDGAYLYDRLAEAERDARLAEVYRRMAAVERKHAAVWEARLKAEGVTLPPFVPGWRTRTLSWVARRFGVGAVLPTLAGQEQKDSGKYARTPDSAE